MTVRLAAPGRTPIVGASQRRRRGVADLSLTLGRPADRRTISREMPTVLLAEDADDLAEIVARQLRANGYAVVRTGNGRSALEAHDPSTRTS